MSGCVRELLKPAQGGISMARWGAKDFLTDLRTGMSSQELMDKYDLSEDRFDQILRKLRRSDLTALRRLWEREKLSKTQFVRAFEEVENDLNGDD
jgi:hypothetical protein